MFSLGSVPGLSYPAWEEVFPHVEVELVFVYGHCSLSCYSAPLGRVWHSPLEHTEIFVWIDEIPSQSSPD